jgi:hypothetical protein
VEFGVEIGEYRGVVRSRRGASWRLSPDRPSLRDGTGLRCRLISRTMNKTGLAVLCLAILLAGCGGSLRGDASAGPNPGGGFYGAPNINIGRINP